MLTSYMMYGNIQVQEVKKILRGNLKMCKTIVDRWIREMEISQGRSKNTISSYVSDVNRFKDYE